MIEPRPQSPRPPVASSLPLVLLVLSACQPAAPPAPAAASSMVEAGAGAEPRPRYGALMSEVGHRFELLGRAGAAGRYALAGYELEELGELFGEDLPRAAPPRVAAGVDLPGLAAAFAATHPAALGGAVKASDAAAFRVAFAAAAAACNACHQASGHAFIEVPARPGDGVPALGPLPAAAPDAGPGAPAR